MTQRVAFGQCAPAAGSGGITGSFLPAVIHRSPLALPAELAGPGRHTRGLLPDMADGLAFRSAAEGAGLGGKTIRLHPTVAADTTGQAQNTGQRQQ